MGLQGQWWGKQNSSQHHTKGVTQKSANNILILIKIRYHITHLKNGWYGNHLGSQNIVTAAFLRFWSHAGSDASENGDDEDVDWEHEETTLHPHHDFLPGDFQWTWIDENQDAVLVRQKQQQY